MKRITLTFFLILSGISANLWAISTVGVFGNFEGGSDGGGALTLSAGAVEVEWDVTDLINNSTLDLKADYEFYSAGIANHLYWNVAAGAGLIINSDTFGVSALVPVELVYNIPPILNGLDIYLQGRPGVSIIPDVDFRWDVGLGVRVAL